MSTSENFESLYKGKNFVFDQRKGERVTNDVLTNCFTCGKPCDDHTNCSNPVCDKLFVQCSDCQDAFHNSCSEDCKSISILPQDQKTAISKEFSKRVKKIQKLETPKDFSKRKDDSYHDWKKILGR